MRITIVGPAGSGKSTLSKRLGKLHNIPFFHMDQYFFNPGWVEKPIEELVSEVEEIVEQNENWVFEGNYSRTLPVRLERSTEVIFLDYPRYIYVWRVFKRLVTNYRVVREDSAPGCPERLNLAFLHYVWTFKTKRRQRLKQQIEEQLSEGCVYHVFSHPKECEAFLMNRKEKMN